MPYGLKRIDLQANAEAKLADAELLLQHGRYSSAYYLAGYSIEIGLKACIALQVAAETIPDKAFLNNVWNHKFSTLLGLAGLATALKEKQDSDRKFAASWAIVLEWSPDARYETKDLMSAQLMVNAVAAANSGVLPWIRTYW